MMFDRKLRKVKYFGEMKSFLKKEALEVVESTESGKPLMSLNP